MSDEIIEQVEVVVEDTVTPAPKKPRKKREKKAVVEVEASVDEVVEPQEGEASPEVPDVETSVDVPVEVEVTAEPVVDEVVEPVAEEPSPVDPTPPKKRVSPKKAEFDIVRYRRRGR
jgi:hypothetical protein